MVGLFISCSVDFLRPSIARACVKLLREANCTVVVPPQSCCGQPGYNNGLRAESASLAKAVIESFKNVDYVVVPSGSCASMLKNHYLKLASTKAERDEAQQFAFKVFELTTFLLDVVNAKPGLTALPCDKPVAYHDSCAGMRELGIFSQPRTLARRYRNTEVLSIPEGESCCGFGGTFCVKFPDISTHMVDQKIDNIRSIDTGLLVGGDLTCLINIEGRLKKREIYDIEVLHIAEFLAGFDTGLDTGSMP